MHHLYFLYYIASRNVFNTLFTIHLQTISLQFVSLHKHFKDAPMHCKFFVQWAPSALCWNRVFEKQEKLDRVSIQRKVNVLLSSS